MTTKITATFNDGDESTVRTLTLPHDVSDRVAELIGFGLIAEVNLPHVIDDPVMVDVEVHRERGDSLACEYVAGDPAPAHNFRIGDDVKVVGVFDGRPDAHRFDQPAPVLTGRQGRVILTQPKGVLVQFGATEPDVWFSPDDIKHAPDLHVSPSIWSAPTIAPDGTKTFTAPGMTCVEHPPTAEDGCPSWTITADTPSTQPCVPAINHMFQAAAAQGSGDHTTAGTPDDLQMLARDAKVAPMLPLHSTREAMREAGLPNWEMGKGLSAADAIRELARQRDEARLRLREHEEDNVRLQVAWTRALAERDEARERLAKQDTHERYSDDGRMRAAHDLRAFVASARWTESTTHGIELSTEDAIKLLTLAEKAR